MKKFIITKNEAIAMRLISQGIRLISNVNNTWTFMNTLPKNFAFSEDDQKQIIYTNILSI